MTGLAGLWRLARLSVSTLGLALVVAGLLTASLSLSRIAGWIPRSVLAVMLVLIAIQLGLEVRERMRNLRSARSPGANPGTASPSPAGSVSAAVAMLWVGGALLAVLLLGMTVGSALFAFIFLRAHAGENRLSSGVFGLALGACLQLVFGAVLKATLYPGWLWQFAR